MQDGDADEHRAEQQEAARVEASPAADAVSQWEPNGHLVVLEVVRPEVQRA